MLRRNLFCVSMSNIHTGAFLYYFMVVSWLPVATACVWVSVCPFVLNSHRYKTKSFIPFGSECYFNLERQRVWQRKRNKRVMVRGWGHNSKAVIQGQMLQSNQWIRLVFCTSIQFSVCVCSLLACLHTSHVLSLCSSPLVPLPAQWDAD